MINRLPSQNPPANLPVEQVPLFVTMGFDDNGHSGWIDESRIEGMRWASEFFASLTNPDGTGNSSTYDGFPGSVSFYHTSKYILGESEEPSELVRKSWYNAIQAGHEAGCHTQNHEEGGEFSEEKWRLEMQLCVDDLAKPYSDRVGIFGLGLNRDQLPGFRTPYLDYNDNTFKAIKSMGFRYDCSIEEGGQPDQDGTNFYWPYTMDQGSPGNQYTSSQEETPLIAPVPGLWEMPCHMVICPPDELCEQYGVASGFRDRMAAIDAAEYDSELFDTAEGKITGLDYNCLAMFNMSAEEWLATLKYTLDLRIAGNRAPFLFGGHTDVYADGYDICPNISIADRRRVLEEFFQYALTKPMVRVVSYNKIIDWLENPIPLA